MLAGKLQSSATGIDPAAWNLANAVFQGSPVRWFRFAAQDTSAPGIFFKPDGLKMYIAGSTSKAIYEYNLSTAWEVSTASYVQSKSVLGQGTNPVGVFFKPDGLKMYVLQGSSDVVCEYDLSTAWDISTASYIQNFSVTAQDTNPLNFFFKPDGLKMYVSGAANDSIYEYDLSTAWDISTASYLQNLSVAAQDIAPKGFSFKPDGLKMFIVGGAGREVNEYSLSTAWNVTTASYVQTESIYGLDDTPSGFFFKPDGLKMYISGNSNSAVYEYILSTAWNVTSASFTNPTTNYKSVRAQDTEPKGVFFKPDGLKMYVVGSIGDDINEYDLSTAWNIATASYLQRFYIGGQESIPQGVFFRADGLKMYVVGSNGDEVNEYDLSTAWDITTASYLQTKSVAAQDTEPKGVFFKPDGLKMYVVGTSADSVFQYDLSTAWNIATASYLQTKSVSAQDTAPSGLFFKPDGLKMYVVGGTGLAVYEYDLSTAWDISTASYIQNFSVLQQARQPGEVFFKPDGLKMYVNGESASGSSLFNAVWSYDFV